MRDGGLCNEGGRVCVMRDGGMVCVMKDGGRVCDER